MTKQDLIALAKKRYLSAELTFKQNKKSEGYIHLLSMSMNLAASEGKEKILNLEEIAQLLSSPHTHN